QCNGGLGFHMNSPLLARFMTARFLIMLNSLRGYFLRLLAVALPLRGPRLQRSAGGAWQRRQSILSDDSLRHRSRRLHESTRRRESGPSSAHPVGIFPRLHGPAELRRHSEERSTRGGARSPEPLPTA